MSIMINEKKNKKREQAVNLKCMVSHRGHNCISSALTILDSALTS